jgi:hypothetical protein
VQQAVVPPEQGNDLSGSFGSACGSEPDTFTFVDVERGEPEDLDWAGLVDAWDGGL